MNDSNGGVILFSDLKRQFLRWHFQCVKNEHWQPSVSLLFIAAALAGKVLTE